MENNREGCLSTRQWAAILAVILVVMLVAGLSPRQLDFENRIMHQPDRAGLVFDGKGIAYTQALISTEDTAIITSTGLTTEIALQVPQETPSGFVTVAVFHNGDDQAQWLLGQWQQHLILMNGDDYRHQRRLPRISVDVSELVNQDFLLTITSTAEGSMLYLNGELANQRTDFVQSLPLGGRLVLGDSIYGENPWSGTVGGLAFHYGALDPAAILTRFQEWQRSKNFQTLDPLGCWLLYALDESSGRQAADLSGNGHHLEFPPQALFLDRVFLSRDSRMPLVEQLLTQDAALNFFGFIPFGWVLAAWMTRLVGKRILVLVLTTTAVGFLFSLGIEYLQTWMPARNSSLLDLQLNTIGAFTGAVLAWVFTRIPDRNRTCI